MEWVGHVVNHHARRALEPDESIGTAESFTEDYALRLRALVIAARVERCSGAVGIEQSRDLWGRAFLIGARVARCSGAVGIEQSRNLCGGYFFEIIAAGEYQLPVNSSDREGA